MRVLQKMESWRDKKGQAFGAYLYQISQSQEDLDQLKSLTLFLDDFYEPSNISSQQRFYHAWFNFYEIEVCPYCKSPRMFTKIPKFSIDRYGEKPTNPVNYYATCMGIDCAKKYNMDRTNKTMLERYNTTNPMTVPGASEKIRANNRKKYGADYYTSTDEFKKKTKETFEEKYGGHPTKLSSTQDKKRKTNIEKYGFSNALLNPEVKEKSMATNNEKYGGNSSMCSSEVRDKSKATNQKKHGVDWYVQSDEFKKKFTETMLARYGVEHAMHHTDSFEKSISTSYRKKIFVFPSGRIEKIQGYEGFAIIDLLNSGYSEDDIIVSNKDIEMHTGVIFYPDSENKKRKYYPDIFVLSENKIIEVKSHYTFDYAYTVNMRKRKASIDMGLSFEFWVYDPAGKRIIS